MNRIRTDDKRIRISISQLTEGLHEYHFSVEPSDIGLENNYKDKVQIDTELDKASRYLYLKSEISSSGYFECDRCIEEFEQKLKSKLIKFFIYDKSDAAKYSDDEVEIINADAAYIDITEDIRETILLSLPLKLLCQDDCKGLCPGCGINLNKNICNCNFDSYDPRWENLRDLIKKRK